MKILNNQETALFQIGDKYLGTTIIKKVPCFSKIDCQKIYKNFEICGGFLCELKPPFNFPRLYHNDTERYRCLFQVSDNNNRLLEKREP